MWVWCFSYILAFKLSFGDGPKVRNKEFLSSVIERKEFMIFFQIERREKLCTLLMGLKQEGW